MKLLSKGLTFMNLLSVLASIIDDGETAELNHSRSKREDFNQNFKYYHRQIPPIQKGGFRISEIKCKQYIRELRYREPKVHIDKYSKLNPYKINASDVNDVLAYTEIGGRDAQPGEFPHMGALGWRTRNNTWTFKCGSTLISHKFSLTAAHCSKIPLDGTIAFQVPEIVRLNSNVIDEFDFNSIDSYILRIIVHPEYVSPKKYYDVALLEHESRLQFTRYLHPACLWSSFNISSLGSEVTTTGWGTVDPVRKTMSTKLQAIDIDIIDTKLCNKLLRRFSCRHWSDLREHQLCAGKLAGGIDSCEGDSGGPLQVKIPYYISKGVTMHHLIGVTSYGIGCARPNLPGVYIRVSSFIDWIECVVWRK